MAQHFLLSAKARTLSLGAILRMTDDEAHGRFEAIRFADNGGAAFCPRCDCTAVYTYAVRRIWKCKACLHQFSVTSGTIFASRKLPIRDYLAAIAIFVNAVKERWLGESAQVDKWLFCLSAARMPRIRSRHVETHTTEPQRGFQGQGGSGRDQG